MTHKLNMTQPISITHALNILVNHALNKTHATKMTNALNIIFR